MSKTDEISQATLLVKRAQEGNRVAFERLANLYHADIFRMVYYRTRSTMDAQDLTQDIFLQAYKNLKRLKETRKFKSWLYSIAINKVRDYYRKKRFQNLFSSFSGDETQADFEAQDDTDALENLARQDFWITVKALLDQLPRMESEVFTLRFLDHLSIKEISITLKKGESTIKTHLYRALKKFRKDPAMKRLLEENL